MSIKDFIAELDGFAQTAEQNLTAIEKNWKSEQARFQVFFDRMITIRGTALQLGLSRIAEIAALGEEIALKAQTAGRSGQVRKCIGALWDVLTTVKYLLHHQDKETSEEQAILVTRLESTLESLGGSREILTAEQIEALLGGDSE